MKPAPPVTKMRKPLSLALIRLGRCGCPPAMGRPLPALTAFRPVVLLVLRLSCGSTLSSSPPRVLASLLLLDTPFRTAWRKQRAFRTRLGFIKSAKKPAPALLIDGFKSCHRLLAKANDMPIEDGVNAARSEEHTSELQPRFGIS